MKKVLQTLLVSFFGVFVALLMVEIVFRAAGLFSTPAKKWSDRPEYYFKDQAASTIQDYSYSEEKPGDVFRISVIGDSFSFAPYMQFTDTFAKKLEQMLNLNDTSMKAEVINHGVPAYSTSHEVAVAQKAAKMKSDLVILQITLNDPEIKGHRPSEIRPDQHDPFGELQFTGWQAKVVKHWRSLGYVLTRLHNQKTHNMYRDYFLDLFENKRSWNAFKKSFEDIQKVCADNNMRLVAVIFPLFGLPLDKNYPFYPIHEKLAQYLTDRSVQFVDISKAYDDIPLERLQVIPGVDRHPNEIAHRMAAEEIYQWLVSRSLIPEELTIRDTYSERMGIAGRGKL